MSQTWAAASGSSGRSVRPPLAGLSTRAFIPDSAAGCSGLASGLSPRMCPSALAGLLLLKLPAKLPMEAASAADPAGELKGESASAEIVEPAAIDGALLAGAAAESRESVPRANTEAGSGAGSEHASEATCSELTQAGIGDRISTGETAVGDAASGAAGTSAGAADLDGLPSAAPAIQDELLVTERAYCGLPLSEAPACAAELLGGSGGCWLSACGRSACAAVTR